MIIIHIIISIILLFILSLIIYIYIIKKNKCYITNEFCIDENPLDYKYNITITTIIAYDNNGTVIIDPNVKKFGFTLIIVTDTYRVSTHDYDNTKFSDEDKKYSNIELWTEKNDFWENIKELNNIKIYLPFMLKSFNTTDRINPRYINYYNINKSTYVTFFSNQTLTIK